MTQRIFRFLADERPDTPCLVVDLDRVEHNYRELAHALPVARIFYAVKANPAPALIERLAAGELSVEVERFDLSEIAKALELLREGRLRGRAVVEFGAGA